MRIGIDCRTILNPETGHAAGIPHYIYHIVSALLRNDDLNEYVLFMDKHAEKRLKDDYRVNRPGVEIRTLPFHHLQRYLPFAYSHMIVARAFMGAKLDVLHAPAHSIPMYYSGPTVVTVHDLAIYDNPEWFPRRVPGALTFSTRVLVPWTLRRAQRIIAVSQATKRDIIRHFGIDGARIDVIHEGVDMPIIEGGGLESPSHKGVLERFGVEDQKFVLFVGTIEPRKNVSSAIRAYANLIERRSDLGGVKMLIAGAKGWKYEGVFKTINDTNRRLGSEKVRYVGYVSRNEKDTLMRHAGAFLFPSLYEGFGLPVMEAMSRGTPVICSDAGSLPEVVGDAALVCAAEDLMCLEDSLERIFTNQELREDMVQRGLFRAKAFSWDVAAQETVRAYTIAIES